MPAMPKVQDTEAVLADIIRLTSIESPTSSPEGVNRAMDVIDEGFRAMGASVARTTPDARYGDMVTATLGDARHEPGILVLSHLDTVHPLGTLQRDLPIRREGDRVYGPGIFDMKGGAMLAVAALRRLIATGRRPALPVTFLFTPDEEVGSPVSRGKIEALAQEAKYVLVTEPKRGGAKVVTSRKGVGRYTVTAHGRPAHAGARHEDGRSAIRAIAAATLEIEGWTDYARGITTNVGGIHGGTATNVIPEHASLDADLRVIDAKTAEEMDARFHALKSAFPDVTLTVTGGMNRPPWDRDAATDRLFHKAQAIANEIGIPLESIPRTGGGSDGNFTAALGVPTLDGLGIDGDGAHTLAEHILVSSIEPGVKLFEALFAKLA